MSTTKINKFKILMSWIASKLSVETCNQIYKTGTMPQIIPRSVFLAAGTTSVKALLSSL